MLDKEITDLQGDAHLRIDAADTIESVEEVRIDLLGRKGKLNEISKQFGKLSPEERAQLGRTLNDAKRQISNRESMKRKRFWKVSRCTRALIPNGWT